MPPSFLVDERGRLVDSYGGVAALLQMKDRRPSAQLLDLLDDDLRTAVSAALHRVAREGDRVGLRRRARQRACRRDARWSPSRSVTAAARTRTSCVSFVRADARVRAPASLALAAAPAPPRLRRDRSRSRGVAAGQPGEHMRALA